MLSVLERLLRLNDRLEVCDELDFWWPDELLDEIDVIVTGTLPSESISSLLVLLLLDPTEAFANCSSCSLRILLDVDKVEFDSLASSLR